MSTPRRLYLYTVCAVSLQAATQALVALLRNLIITRLNPEPSAIAWQLAVILIGLGAFLPHWIWALRAARREPEEQESVVRRLYLYGMQAAFLGPFVNSAFNIAARLLAELARQPASRRLHPDLPAGEFLLYHLVGAVVLGLFWFYHQRVLAEEDSAATEVDGPAVVRRLYVLIFSAAGLGMTTIAIVNLLRWILLQLGASPESSISGPAFEIARLTVGMPLWLVFWRKAERLFAGPVDEERASALRKFYLFSVVSLAALISVTAASILLASLFRQLLKAGDGQSDPRLAIAVIVSMGMLWTYHGLVLRQDTRRVSESPSQAGVRRLYTYLIAGIGLSAAVIGLGGLVSVILLSFERFATATALREQLAWSAAALIAGLPVWGWPWRGAQTRGSSQGPTGDEERRSLARKGFLYFFLLAATLGFLGSAVYLLSRILSVLLGEPGPGLSELGHSIAFGILAVGLWLYHGAALRADRRLGIGAAGLEQKRVTVVELDESSFGAALIAELRKRIPGVDIASIQLGAAARRVPAGPRVQDQLSKADLIIGPWTITAGRRAGGPGVVTSEFARAISESPSKKLLIPTRAEGFEWAGVDPWKQEAMVRHAASAALQLFRGEEVKPARPLGAGAIIAIVLAVAILLPLIVGPLISLLLF